MLRLEDLAQLAANHPSARKSSVRPLILGSQSLDFNARPVIAGVVNLSHDSWYRESVCLTPDQALRRARVLRAQGADLIDLGAESTLAHADRISSTQQCERLLPIVSELVSSGIAISIETYEPKVAQAVLRAGAVLINFTGHETAESMYRVVAEFDAAVILCHVQGSNVRQVTELTLGHDPIPEFQTYFERQIELATRCGVTKIVLDPGLGFYYRNLRDSSARVRYQMNTFLNTFRLRTLGYPICHALPHAFEYFGEEVRCAEPFFAVLAALGGTDLFRTHEVARIKAVLDTMGAW